MKGKAANALLLLAWIGCASATSIDVSQYSKLYVSYQNCVWSPYANGCNQEEDENYWYTAFAPCYRANAAFTVYGVPVGETLSSKDDACTKGTFVGSYFTTNGIDDFLDALAQAGAQLSGENDDEDNDQDVCEIVNQGDDEQGDNEDQAVDYTANNRKMYGNTKSSGLGCTSYHKFAVKTYSGAYCDERAVLQITDPLESFNQELEQNAQCILVYDAANENQQDNNEEDEEDEEQQAVNSVDFLDYSEACNVRLYPNTCPDPFGRLHGDARAVGRNMQKGSRVSKVKTAFSWILMTIGAVSMGVSAWACYNKSNRKESRSTASSDSSSKGSRWRASPFKRDAPEQAQPTSSTSNNANTSTPRKKRRFFRLFSRGGSS